MLLPESLRIACRALATNRLRSVLTALSVSIGAGSISLLMSLSSSAVSSITSGIDAVGGRHLVLVLPHDAPPESAHRYARGLTVADARALEQRVPGLNKVAFLAAMRAQHVAANGKEASADVALGSSYLQYMQQRVAYGAGLGAEDSGARVTLLSEGLATKLFGSPEAAVGGEVVLWDHPYRVAGVTTASTKLGFNISGLAEDRAMFVTERAAEAEGLRPQGVLAIDDGAKDYHDWQVRDAAAVLTARHRGVVDYEMLDVSGYMSEFDRVVGWLKILTGLIAGVSLVLAGAGIMNVLLASIRQRLREIGLRRALGATKRAILLQFVVEASLLGGIGGLLGGVGGSGVAWGAGAIAAVLVPGWEPRVSWAALAVAVVCALGSGAFFGLVPARRASQLSVTECLRSAV